MKNLFYYLAVLLCVAMLLFSCNRIDTVGFDNESVATKDMTSAHSLKVTHQEAQGVADMFLRSEAGSVIFQTKSAKAKRVSSSSTVREDGQELMYIFNYDDGGFVIVGATRDYYPILAYSDKGSFVLREDMGPVDVWLDETKVCIKNSSLLDETTKAQMRNLWARYNGTYVDLTQQLLSSRRPQTRSAGEDSCWAEIERLQALYGSQGWTFLPLSQVEEIFDDAGLSSYYDDICYSATQNHSALNETVIGFKNAPILNSNGPLLYTSHWHQDAPFNQLCNGYPAGCSVIAAAQIMKYYEFPPSSHLNWAGSSFAWSQIPDTPSYQTTDRQPQLIRYTGTKFGITYINGDTGATPQDIKEGLEDMGFTATLSDHNYLVSYSQIYDYSKPVLMSGHSTLMGGNGHAWVCDGARKYIFDQITFFTENQPYGAGSFSQGMYTIINPGTVGGIVTYYFYMKFGKDYDESDDGWYTDNGLPSGSNYQYRRNDIYITCPDN